MKKLLYIVTLATLLCSCSAEKRLAYLLEHHPELRKDSVYVIDTVLVHQADTATTTFTIEQLQQLLAQQDTSAKGDNQAPAYADSTTHHKSSSNYICVENSGSKAVIKPNADGTLSLQSMTKPDTITIRDTLHVPVYYTTYKDKLVYKMNNAQTFFFGLGILFLILIALVIGLKIAKFFI